MAEQSADSLVVTCGELRGTLDVTTFLIQPVDCPFNDNMVPVNPAEFERLAGRWARGWSAQPGMGYVVSGC
jgi:hypothetical protein